MRTDKTLRTLVHMIGNCHYSDTAQTIALMVPSPTVREEAAESIELLCKLIEFDPERSGYKWTWAHNGSTLELLCSDETEN